MPIDLPPTPAAVEHLVTDAVNELAADTVGRPPLLDVVNDLAAPCDPA